MISPSGFMKDWKGHDLALEHLLLQSDCLIALYAIPLSFCASHRQNC